MFDQIKSIWKESRGNLLKSQLLDSLQKLSGADLRLLQDFYKSGLAIYPRIEGQFYKLSEKGRIAKGKQLQHSARQKFDFDVGSAYAEWMIGIWLECSSLPGTSAQSCFNFLNQLFKRIADGDGSYDYFIHGIARPQWPSGEDPAIDTYRKEPMTGAEEKATSELIELLTSEDGYSEKEMAKVEKKWRNAAKKK